MRKPPPRVRRGADADAAMLPAEPMASLIPLAAGKRNRSARSAKRCRKRSSPYPRPIGDYRWAAVPKMLLSNEVEVCSMRLKFSAARPLQTGRER
jgi:hypothetical protein